MDSKSLRPRYVTIDLSAYDVELLVYALRRDGYTPLANNIEADYAAGDTYIGKHRPERAA